MTTPKAGQRYTKDGIAVDVHAVRQGMVYIQTWPKDAILMLATDGLSKVKIEDFMKQIEGATLEDQRP